jgi:hypothetical protein
VTLGVIAALRGPSRGIAITRASIVGRHRAPGHLGQGVGGVGLAWLVTPFQSSGLEDGLLQRGQGGFDLGPTSGVFLEIKFHDPSDPTQVRKDRWRRSRSLRLASSSSSARARTRAHSSRRRRRSRRFGQLQEPALGRGISRGRPGEVWLTPAQKTRSKWPSGTTAEAPIIFWSDQ